jgi:hypothetical protein
VPVTAAHAVQMPPAAPDVSALQVVLAPHGEVPPDTQQLPATHEPAQHSSPLLSVHCTSFVLFVAQPEVAATHVPSSASPVFVSQMFPLAHCESSVQPPQTFGVEKPQVGVVGVEVQSVLELQLPGMHEPALHTYGVVPPPYAVVQLVSCPALVLPLSHATQTPPEQTPFAPLFEHAVASGQAEVAPSAASDDMLPSPPLAAESPPLSVDAESPFPPLSVDAESTLPPLSVASESPPPPLSSLMLSFAASEVFPPSVTPTVDEPPPQPVTSNTHAAPATLAHTSQ